MSSVTYAVSLRPVVSELGHALLGLLARKPATGYDLMTVMDRTVGYFWAARHSQIYPELAKLEVSGHVRHREVSGAGPRATKRYSLTAAGRAELREWATSDPAPAADRDPVLLRVASLWTTDPAAAEDFVRRVRATSVQRHALYQGFADEIDAESDPGRHTDPDWAMRATVEAGLRYQQGRIDWCDWLLDRIRGVGPDPPS